MGRPPIAVVGQTYGLVTVLDRIEPDVCGWGIPARYECRCACGAVFEALGSDVVSGRRPSCGCRRRALRRMQATQHGLTRTPTWMSWKSMHMRCEPMYKGRAIYADRGVCVCERWQSFDAFLADMGERPAGKSIDRYPDNDGNYEPGNCRWATPAEQARNRRDNTLNAVAVSLIRHSARRGQRQSDIAWAFGLDPSVVSRVVHRQLWRSAC